MTYSRGHGEWNIVKTVCQFLIYFVKWLHVSYLSDKVLTEGRGDPFPGMYTTVHPDSFLFLSSIEANLEDTFI